MYKKLYDICSITPIRVQENSIVSHIVDKIIRETHEYPFIFSEKKPDDNNLIYPRIDQFQNDNENLLEGFEEMGENEKYITCSILYSADSLLYVIGGVGIGKSRYFLYYQNLINRLYSRLNKIPGETLKPLNIKYDFNARITTELSSEDSQIRSRKFCEMMTDLISSEINSYLGDRLSFKDEIEEVFNYIETEVDFNLKENYATDFIRTRLRNDDAGSKHMQTKHKMVIRLRKEIYSDLKKDAEKYLSYLIFLLTYIRKKFYNNDNKWVTLIIDNVDMIKTRMAITVNQIIQPIKKKSDLKILITSRPDTFSRVLNTNVASNLTTVVEYCGVKPYYFLIERFNYFMENLKKFQDPSISDENLLSISYGIAKITKELKERSYLKEFISAICARSIRRSLVHGSFILNNGYFDLIKFGSEKAESSFDYNYLARAIITGGDCMYYNGNNENERYIENIFELEGNPKPRYLLKLRILKFINSMTGGKRINFIHLRNIEDCLIHFGYNVEEVDLGISQMLKTTKRLIWSESLTENTPIPDYENYRNAQIHCTNIGMGCTLYIFQDLNYVQEVLLDTRVKVRNYGIGLDYNKMDTRFDAVCTFLKELMNEDLNEVREYSSNFNRDEYYRAMGTETLVSEDIVKSILDRLSAINEYSTNISRNTKENIVRITKELTLKLDDSNKALSIFFG